MNADFLFSALIFFGSALLMVPVAKRLGFSSVLGYLFAGIIIGPYVLGFVQNEGTDIMHAAEFGVVMMLFIIGLELEPAKFWEMRKSIVGLGGLQMGITSIVLFPVLYLFGWEWKISLAVALSFSMSSTAIVLQTLKEKNLSRTVAGEASFSVLLFQDIAVIPLLAMLPFLSDNIPHENAHASPSLIEDLPAILQALSVVAAIAIVYLAGRFMVVPFLRFVSRSGLRELFSVASLFLVFGVAYVMQLVGLSPALGTFMAGVILANSEFRHELETDIEPFKGILLGIFFISVGSTIKFSLIGAKPQLIFSLASIAILLKFLILFFIGRFYKISGDQNRMFAFGLSQIGEFAFVLLSFAFQVGIFSSDENDVFMAVAAITMLTTPFLLMLNEKIIEPRFGIAITEEEKTSDVIDELHKVIIAGFGHFGSTIGRLLRANGVDATILDNDPDRVELLRKMGFKVYYGDATRIDLLKSAGIEEASILICAIDNPEVNKELVHMLKDKYPQLKVFARAKNRIDAYDFIDMGVENIYRETLYTAVHLGVDVLAQLGFRKHTATRQGQKFILFDEKALSKLATKRHDKTEYILNIRQEIEMQEQLLQNDLFSNLNSEDHSWDSQYMKEKLSIPKSE
jgi:monovalent cation:H+ antiporter-2, CPA2 family